MTPVQARWRARHWCTAEELAARACPRGEAIEMLEQGAGQAGPERQVAGRRSKAPAWNSWIRTGFGSMRRARAADQPARGPAEFGQ